MKSLLHLLSFVLLTVSISAQDYTWELQETNTTNRLYDVFFVTDETGYVVGEEGTVLKTVNSGEEWELLDLDFTGTFNVVHFVNTQIGFVGGGDGNAVFKTSDGGGSWELIDDGMEAILGDEVNDIYFVNELTGFIASTSGMSRTTDGGASWQQLDESYVYVDAIEFYGENIGYAACAAGILKTTDMGQTWVVQKEAGSSDFDNGAIVRSIQAMSPDTVCFGASYYSAFYSSTDGGETLNYETRSIFGLDFLTSQVGFAVSVSNEYHSTVLKTTDMGETWEVDFENLTVEGVSLRAIWMLDEHEGWVVGNDGLIRHRVLAQPNAINELNQAQITVYPNPTTDVVSISMDQLPIDLLHVHDAYARVCATASKGKAQVNVSHLKAGTYFLQVQSQGAIRSVPFIKE